MRITLEPDQVDLLQAVDDGLVARHRAVHPTSARGGVDYQDCPDNGLGPRRRRAAARLKELSKLRLVELPTGTAAQRVWPWRLTPRGRTALEHARTSAETAEPTP